MACPSVGARFATRSYRIFSVQCPLQRVIHDVFADAVQRFVIADDVFVIIALPQFYAGGITHFIDAACGRRFEQTYNRWDGIGCRFTEFFHRRDTFIICRGMLQRASTVRMQYNDPVKMVRHHHKRVQFNIGSYFRRAQPFILDDFSHIAQPHFPVCDFPEQAGAILRADGHKIRPGLRIS
jgi:hypothetical protein